MDQEIEDTFSEEEEVSLKEEDAEDIEERAQLAFEDMLDAELTMGSEHLINVSKEEMVYFLSLKYEQNKK